MSAKKSTGLCRNCEDADKVKIKVSDRFPLSSCEVCEILQSFVEVFA
jgi:hypothetical protein